MGLLGRNRVASDIYVEKNIVIASERPDYTTYKKVDVLIPLREKCPYSELFWSFFSRIRTEYGEILRISPYSFCMRGNTGQNNSEYGHFLRSVSQ